MNIINKKIIWLSLIIILLMLPVILLQKNNKKNIYVDKQSVVNPDWQIYRNTELGVEIKYPKRYYVWNQDCTLPKKITQSAFSLIPTKVFIQNNTLYIGPAYTFEEDDSVCNRVDVNAEKLDDYGILAVGSLKIVIRNNVFNDQDLNNVVKEFYGAAGDQCYINEKKLSSQEGVYDIIVNSDGKDIETSHCWIDSPTYLKYYPKKNKIMFTELGMDYSLWANISGTEAFDHEVIESFKFID